MNPEEPPLMRLGPLLCEWAEKRVTIKYCREKCGLLGSLRICPRSATFEEWMYHENNGRWRRLR